MSVIGKIKTTFKELENTTSGFPLLPGLTAGFLFSPTVCNRYYVMVESKFKFNKKTGNKCEKRAKGKKKAESCLPGALSIILIYPLLLDVVVGCYCCCCCCC
jgi:hypothetical protein